MSSGIQQKNIIVTCNYVARDLGVTKLMSVTDAKEKCPQLVLVKGEDLTHYREMSYKLTGRQDAQQIKLYSNKKIYIVEKDLVFRVKSTQNTLNKQIPL